MDGYQDRLLDEYAALEGSTERLATFVVSEDFAKLSLADQSYLEAQLPVQQRLLAILASRVAAQKTAKEVAKPKAEPTAKVAKIGAENDKKK